MTSRWHSEADDLRASLRQTGVARATLVGSSHGGEISIDVTLTYPELVRHLIVIGPLVSGLPYSDHFIARAVANSVQLRNGDVTGGLKAWAANPYLISPRNDAARKKLLDLLLANPQNMTHPNQLLPPKQALPRLGDIHVPTLNLVGDADIADVHAHAGAIEAGIGRSRRVVITGTGHLMYLEKPGDFVRAVIGFIDANAP